MSIIHPTTLWRHNALIAIVCPSVCPMPDPKSITEERRKLKIGSKEVHDKGDS